MADIKEIAEKLINLSVTEVNNLSSLTQDEVLRTMHIDKLMSPKEFGISKMNRRKKRWNQKS